MRRLIWILMLLLSSSLPSVAQENIRSANSMLPHCKAGLESNTLDPIGGRCLGIIATLAFVSRVLPDDLKFCSPSTATVEQMLNMVIGYVESHPEHLPQDFRLAALIAMGQAYPCSE
jgi:hypothetical protein